MSTNEKKSINNTRSTQVCNFHCNCNCICTWVSVIGCGHYWIPSNKSNACFPAFLVRLPRLFTVEHHLVREKLEEENSAAPIHQRFMVDDFNAVKYQYRWRSKRDFLFIKHAATSLHYRAKNFGGESASSASHQSLLYPKSALEKLCERAAMQGPWIQPDLIMHCSDVPVHGTTSNSWIPQQQKSLQTVNEYLRNMYQIYCYCRNELSQHGGSDESCLRFKEAFENFCQEQDPANIILHAETLPAFSKNCSSISSKKNRMVMCSQNKISSRSIVTSSLLGQYFASIENVDYVIKRLLHTLISMKLCADTCIFVEPSVGDGRILSKLISSSEQFITATTNPTLQRQERHHDGNCEQGQRLLRCVGYDIDPSAVQMAHKTLDRNESISRYETMKSTIVCQDFLTATYQDVINHSPCHTTNTDFSRHEQHILVVGGPPYTLEGRSDDNETCGTCCDKIRSGRFDLAKRFVLHSLLSLRASAVLFILPKRCEWQASEIHRELSVHSNYHAKSIAHQALFETDSLPSPAGEVTVSSNCIWSHCSEELPNNYFDFQGKWVKQPSILQIWTCTRQL